MADEKTTITAQLPDELVEQLRTIAKIEGRSLSSQIRLFLADAVTRQNTATQQPKAA
jgi:predicted transcriptional regulator